MNLNAAYALTALTALLLSLLPLSPVAPAQTAGWTMDGVGVRVGTTTPGDGMTAKVVPDGAGGAIVTWMDTRAKKWDLYAQRIDLDGKTMWKANGVGIRAKPGTPNNAYLHCVTADGAGGAIIAWQDTRSVFKWEIFAQRVDGNGRVLWTADGVGVRSLPGTPGDARYPELIPDGTGGAIVAWQDRRSGGKFDIYAQRVNARGKCLWTADGVVVRSVSSKDAIYPQLAPDGSGGAILTWQDSRSGGRWNIYAQHVGSTGRTVWAANGVPVRAGPSYGGDAIAPKLASAGTGGAIVAWQDFRSGTRYDIYVQKLDSAGTSAWAPGGVSMLSDGSVPGYRIYPELTTDGFGGAIVAWQDWRSGENWQVFAQRVNHSGNLMWAPGGTIISRTQSQGGDAQIPRVVTAGAGGSIISWQENRPGGYSNVCAQGVDPSGKRLWTVDGLNIRSAFEQKEPSNPFIASDGRGGAIVAWQEKRFGGKWDIYANSTGPAASTFYFAEGYTGDGFEEYLCIGNTSVRRAAADVTYIFDDGTSREARYNIAEKSRLTVRVNDAAGQGREVAMVVRSALPGLVAERPMYFNYLGRWSGGSDVIGAPFPATRWYFAEGTTLSGFDQYLTVLNLNPAEAALTFNYMAEGESLPKVHGLVGAGSRATFKTRDQVGDGKNVSLMLESDLPIVAERPIYFNYKGMGWTGGHDVVGARHPSATWHFAEGTTRPGFEEWLCLQNPNPKTINVKAVFQLSPGQGPLVEKTYAVAPYQRLTKSVNAELGADKDCSISLSSESEYIAERPMYFNHRGRYTGGHIVLGSAYPSTSWVFAEGYTETGFEEWLCLQNPSSVTANAMLKCYPSSGEPIVKNVALPPGSRSTLDINLIAGTGREIAMVVTSDTPVIAERSMYFVHRGLTGGHAVVGY